MWPYADSKGPDQPAHPHSLIGAFAVRKQNHLILQTVSMESKCPDETLRIRKRSEFAHFAHARRPCQYLCVKLKHEHSPAIKINKTYAPLAEGMVLTALLKN